MKKDVFTLWDEIPLSHESKIPTLTYFTPEGKKSDAAVIILPGGAYCMCSDYEGTNYALELNAHGVSAFVLDYRLHPDAFPVPLLDARRAVRFVRANAAKFGISPDKILIMGSSAGGHLAALCSTYTAPIDGEGADETDLLSPIPNGQILCYPVIELADEKVAHLGSAENLLGPHPKVTAEELSPNRIADKNTPPAFMFATVTDEGVPMENSTLYLARLQEVGVSAELHLFPYGPHGIGLADGSGAFRADAHLHQWVDLLLGWMEAMHFTDKM